MGVIGCGREIHQAAQITDQSLKRGAQLRQGGNRSNQLSLQELKRHQQAKGHASLDDQQSPNGDHQG